VTTVEESRRRTSEQLAKAIKDENELAKRRRRCPVCGGNDILNSDPRRPDCDEHHDPWCMDCKGEYCPVCEGTA
jgi:hypothetical protein